MDSGLYKQELFASIRKQNTPRQRSEMSLLSKRDFPFFHFEALVFSFAQERTQGQHLASCLLEHGEVLSFGKSLSLSDPDTSNFDQRSRDMISLFIEIFTSSNHRTSSKFHNAATTGSSNNMSENQENNPFLLDEPQAEVAASSSSTPTAPSSSSTSLTCLPRSPLTSPASQPTVPECSTCNATSPDPETKPLKPCSKCKSVSYCSKECQKTDFKKHKKDCAGLAQVYAQTADLKPAPRPKAPKDGFRGGLQKWQFDT